jgi:hypothetical protein
VLCACIHGLGSAGILTMGQVKGVGGGVGVRPLYQATKALPALVKSPTPHPPLSGERGYEGGGSFKRILYLYVHCSITWLIHIYSSGIKKGNSALKYVK